MAKCITDVISPRQGNSSTDGDDAILSSFTEAVNKAANSVYDASSKLEATNCTKIVFDWCKDTMGINAYTAVDALSKMKFGIKQFNSYNYPVNLSKIKLSDNFCQMLSTWIAWIQESIDISTKAAFALFIKIDAARMRLETATLNFNTAILKCLSDILSDLKISAGIGVDVGVSASLSFDWDELYLIMVDCPCFCRAISCVTGCNTDSSGNDTSRDPDYVISCLKSKFSIGTELNLGIGLTGSMNDLLFDFLYKLYMAIQTAIEMTFELLMQPLRALIKAFADLLTQKFDVSLFIKTLGNFECFFNYSLEYKHNKEFYGMSIIDMINTFKGWTQCFTHLCPSLAKDVEAKLKDINESLRLNDSFWTGALEADLYSICIATKLGYASFSSYEMREIYRDNPKSKFDSLLSELKATGIKNLCTEYKRKNAYKRVSQRSATEDAILFRTAPDRENEVNVGEIPISSSEEKKCVTMAKNLIDKTVSPYFTEKFYQLLRLLSDYAMDSDTVNDLTKILDNSSKKTYPAGFSKKFTPFPGNITGREELSVYPDDTEVSYELTDDYDAAEIEEILGAYA